MSPSAARTAIALRTESVTGTVLVADISELTRHRQRVSDGSGRVIRGDRLDLHSICHRRLRQS